MPINIACPQCQRQFVVRDEIAGKSFRCKDCEAIVSVPALKSAPQNSVQPKSAAPQRKATTPEPPAEDEWGYETWQDDQQSELPIPAPRAKRKAVAERSADANKSPVVPIEGILSIASIAVLGVLNLWVLISPDEILWKLIAAIRIAVEARVVWGIRERNGQTGLAATIAAVMMTLISAFMLWSLISDPEVRADVSPQELRNGQIFVTVQLVAEIGVIVGLNLPRTRRWMATGNGS
ncbi:MAG: hypothetical protein DWI00_03755 [Planctomycetota bacterium]|nr:MAG: hypothetical protein DWI00_03755 [Planctomycetota bacterium]